MRYLGENEIRFDGKNRIKIIISIVISLVLTLVLMNFIDLNDMQDTFKINLKTTALSKVVKYYTLTCVFIGLIIYNVLNFVIISIMNFIARKTYKDY